MKARRLVETFDNHDDLYTSHMRPWELGVMEFEDCLSNYIDAVNERLIDLGHVAIEGD